MNKVETKLTSTSNSRSNLIAAATTLNDDFLTSLEEEERSKIVYHVKTCQKTYLLKSVRSIGQQVTSPDLDDTYIIDEEVPSRAKRRKSNDLNELCIICNHKKVKGEKKLFRVSDPNRAKLFIAAYRFNQDDAFARCSIFSTAGDIFAADVLSHKLCMKMI